MKSLLNKICIKAQEDLTSDKNVVDRWFEAAKQIKQEMLDEGLTETANEIQNIIDRAKELLR